MDSRTATVVQCLITLMNLRFVCEPEKEKKKKRKKEKIGQNNTPLYSIPHFNFTMTGLPVKSFRKGFGFTGTV
jgi:hypothetical protein